MEKCPICNGTGRYVESTTGGKREVLCFNCGGSGKIDISKDMMQGCRHNFPQDHMWTTGSPVNGLPRSEKTLLDEFAMAAMQGMMSGGANWHEAEKNTSYAFDQAAAMMRERARRDEMGNVKEE